MVSKRTLLFMLNAAALLSIFIMIVSLRNEDLNNHIASRRSPSLGASLERKLYSFAPNPFEPDNGECSVRLMNSTDEFDMHLEGTIGNAPECTMEYFKNYMYKYGRLVGTGTFVAPPDGQPSMETIFYPEGCKFANQMNNIKQFRTCFQQKSIESILITGDSNGVVLRAQFDNFISELNGEKKCERFTSCRYSLNETTFDYFRVLDMDNKTLLVEGEPCQKVRCSLLDDASFTLERISMIHVLDASVHIENPIHTPEGRFLHTPTKFEYLLKYFYPNKGFPSLWLFMLPFHHECLSNSLDEMRADLVYMMEMFEIFLPSTTQLVLMADTRTCPDRDVPKMKEELVKRNITYNKCIHDMNQVMVEVLLERDLPDNIHVFLDMTKISCPLVCTWHKDGQHMQHVWYKFMFKFLLESFCLDVL